MAVNITVSLEDRPGELAGAADALADQGINVEGICGQTVGGVGIVHFLVEDGAAAKAALEAAGVDVVAMEELLVIGVEDKPGVLARISRSLADAGINIHIAYLASATRLVLGVNDLQRARQVVGQAS